MTAVAATPPRDETGRLRAILPKLAPFAGILAAAMILPFVSNDYWALIGTRAAIYWVLVSGLNLVVGFAGHLAIGYVALLTLGAYTTSVLVAGNVMPRIPERRWGTGADFGGQPAREARETRLGGDHVGAVGRAHRAGQAADIDDRAGIALFDGFEARLHAMERAIEDNVPVEFQAHAHHWLILHGRYICKARTPECWRCPVSDLCGYKAKSAEPTPKRKAG